MIIIKSELECVAVRSNQYPETGVPEIAFAGRSNVGKSSLLNLITGRKSLARVSGSPGKTRTINFYRCTGRIAASGEKDAEADAGVNGSDGKTAEDVVFRIVDLPGYGFARVSKAESQKWGEMMEAYLEHRDDLLKVVQLVDIRHKPSAQDIQMYEYLNYYGLEGIVAATKADKVNASERAKNIKLIRQTLGMNKQDKVIPVSALKRTGDTELLTAIEKLLIQ